MQKTNVLPFKTNYFKQNCWALDPLPDIQKELHWRRLTNSPPLEIVLAGYYAGDYYEVPQSCLERMVVNLPYNFYPSHFGWPVKDLDVSIVETGCYERTLLALCTEYGAASVTLYESRLAPYSVPMLEKAEDVA